MADVLYTHVCAEPGRASIIDGVVEGRGIDSGDTLAEVQRRYPDAQRYDCDDWQREARARPPRPITWHATTEEVYTRMLEGVPPARRLGAVFLVGEPSDHDSATGRPRFEGCRQRGETFEVGNRPMTCAEARAEVARAR